MLCMLSSLSRLYCTIMDPKTFKKKINKQTNSGPYTGPGEAHDCSTSFINQGKLKRLMGPKSSKNRAGSHDMPCCHPCVLRGLALTGPVNYPGVSCNRGILISILWQPMRSFVTSGGQSWIASACALRISSCTCNDSTIWEYEINSVSSESLETTLKL